MMVIVPAPPLKYVRTIGLLALTGRGFSNPINAAVNRDGLIYVVNRSNSTQAPMGAARITICNIDGEYIGEFAGYGLKDGEFIWPNGIDLDSQGNIYLADEHRNDIQVWDAGHAFVRKFGVGLLNRPAGVAIDSADNVLVADALNNRVVRFAPGGSVLQTIAQGELNMPWGVAVDEQDNVYVADWRNDRVQKFSPSGEHLMTFGSSGSEVGQLHRPADVAVDSNGNVYVADWGNERVSIFEPDGYPLTTLLGDADLSKWGAEYISANEDIIRGRHLADLAPEKYFWGPTGVTLDHSNHLIVVESCRHRLQIYERVPYDDV